MTDGIRKLAAYVPITREMLDEAEATTAAVQTAFRRTPEEWAEVEARQAERRATRLVEATARHDAVRAQLHGKLLAEVLDLHGPQDGSLSPVCRGCEFGGYDAEPPEWPCETWALIAEGLE